MIRKWSTPSTQTINGMNGQSIDLIYIDPPFNSQRMYSASVGSKVRICEFKQMLMKSIWPTLMFYFQD